MKAGKEFSASIFEFGKSKAMEKTWAVFLSQLSSPDPEFTYDDVSEWPQEEFDDLNRAGLITEMASATHVVCNACPEAHWERVRWSEDGKRASIPCPTNGIVTVDLERLRRWQGRPTQLSVLLAQALALSGKVQPLPAGRLWFLGQRRTAGRTPYFFFAAIGPDELLPTMTEIRQAYGRVTGVLLLPFPPPEPVETSKIQLVDLRLVVSLHTARIVADVGFIEDQLTDPAGAKHSAQVKKTSRSLAAHRRSILKASIPAGSANDMGAIARRLGVDVSALHGMARGDRTRYSDDKLELVLKKISCTRAKWDRAAKPSARK
jgi:hypothetical protein